MVSVCGWLENQRKNTEFGLACVSRPATAGVCRPPSRSSWVAHRWCHVLPVLGGTGRCCWAACTAVHLYIALVACVVVLLQWLYFSANIGFAVHSHWYLGGLLHTHARLACMPSGSPLKYADDQGRTRAPRHTSSAGRQGGRFSSVERGVAPKGSRDSRRGATDGLAG